MYQDRILQAWIPLVDFLAEALGPACEVVLHDLRDLERSIIAIRNNHISGRQVGDSSSDFALEIIQNHARNKNADYVASYYGALGDGGKTLRLSSYFIYDDDKNLIGMLGLNMDFSALEEARNLIDRFIGMGLPPAPPPRNEKPMHFNLSEDYLPSVVERTIEAGGVEPARMTVEEKRSVVEELQQKGVFLLKGAVTEIAKRLEVSEQTVYRYLKDMEGPREGE